MIKSRRPSRPTFVVTWRFANSAEVHVDEVRASSADVVASGFGFARVLISVEPKS